MVTIAISCPHCGQVGKVVKMGYNTTGEPRCKCRACGKTFQTRYRYRACQAGVKDQILSMAINGSGIRDTARVLAVSQTTVIETIRKKNRTQSLSIPFLSNKPKNQAETGSN